MFSRDYDFILGGRLRRDINLVSFEGRVRLRKSKGIFR